MHNNNDDHHYIMSHSLEKYTQIYLSVLLLFKVFETFGVTSCIISCHFKTS